ADRSNPADIGVIFAGKGSPCDPGSRLTLIVIGPFKSHSPSQSARPRKCCRFRGLAIIDQRPSVARTIAAIQQEFRILSDRCHHHVSKSIRVVWAQKLERGASQMFFSRRCRGNWPDQWTGLDAPNKVVNGSRCRQCRISTAICGLLSGLLVCVGPHVSDWLTATDSEAAKLPRDVADRVERVFEFHRSTKYSYQSVRANPIVLDWKAQPSPYRTFTELPKTALPTNLLDAPVPTLSLLSEGLAAVPESLLQPPQNIKTLATWLYLSNGMTVEKQGPAGMQWLRTSPSGGGLYPFELYVAAFGIEGVEPGLYHYSIREFALRKIRNGVEAMFQIKRGRPDLDFIKSVPAMILVSTPYWRSAWRYRQRGYRCALLDAGHLVQNLVGAANALGIQTMPRFLVNDNTMRDLIGIPANADFGVAESVQAMVIWADTAMTPMEIPRGSRPPAPNSMPVIPRKPLSAEFVPYGSILATHQDCVAPGMP